MLLVFSDLPSFIRLLAWVLNTPARAARRALRGAGWRRFASEHGLTFEANRPDLAERWNLETGPVPRAGTTRTVLHSARNVVSGTLAGQPFLTFEAEWAVDESEVILEQFRRRQVVVLGLPAALSPLEVRGRVGLTGRGMTTDSPAFSKDWFVLTRDEPQAHALLTDEVRALIAQLPPKEPTWQFFGAELVLSVPGYRDPETVQHLTALTQQIIRAVPAFVWSDATLEP